MAAAARLDAVAAGCHSIAAGQCATSANVQESTWALASCHQQLVRSPALPRLCSRQPSVREFAVRKQLVGTRRRAVSIAAEAGVQQETASSVEDVPLKSEMGVSYELLRDKLAAGEWEEADNETRRLMCELAGEGAVKRKWVYFSEVQFIPVADLDTIDRLWKAYSDGKFGFSVQRKIWTAAKRSWKIFFMKIGWTVGERRDYRKFPMEFLWKLDAETPTGHLPLTNALRGTQLLEAILKHPAFDFVDDEVKLTGDSFDKYTSSSMPTSSTSASKPATETQRANAPLPEAYMADFNF